MPIPADETERDEVATSLGLIADDSFRLLRLNLVIIGIYVSGIALLFQSVNEQAKVGVMTSYYTHAGIIAWLASSLVAFFTYESSRRLSVCNLYEDPEHLMEKYAGTSRLVFNIRYAVGATLVSGVAFALGVWDALIPVGIGFFDFVWPAFFSLLVIATTPILLFYLGRKTKERILSIWN